MKLTLTPSMSLKKVVLNIDTVSKRTTLATTFCYKSIYTFIKLYFEINLLTSLSYFQTQPKRNYL